MKSYIAWKLDPDSVVALRRHFPGRFENVPSAPYVMCLWNVTFGDPEARMLIGQRKAGAIIGHCVNESLGIECAVIRGILSTRPIPHITLSYKDGVELRVSNDALKIGPVHDISAFLLAGTYELVRVAED